MNTKNRFNLVPPGLGSCCSIFCAGLVMASLLLTCPLPASAQLNACAQRYGSMQLAQASHKQTIENRNLKGQMGWSLELPASWINVPNFQPSWPEGAAYRDTLTPCFCNVTWMAQEPAEEIASLSERHFRESQVRLGGHNARCFTKVDNGNITQFVYCPVNSTTYRLCLSGPGACRTTLEDILRNYTFLRASSTEESDPALGNSAGSATSSIPDATANATENAWATHVNNNGGMELSYPAYCTILPNGKNFKLMKDGRAWARVSFLPAGTTPGQSFRGFARSVGKEHIPGALKLADFTPYTLPQDKQTAYQAIWEVQENGQKTLRGPFIYVLLKDEVTWYAACLELAQPDDMSDFFRMINSIKLFVPNATVNIKPEP